MTDPAPSFVAFIDLAKGEVFSEAGRLATVISLHSSKARQLSIRVRALDGRVYHARVRRRPNGAVSRATFHLVKGSEGAGQKAFERGYRETTDKIT